MNNIFFDNEICTIWYNTGLQAVETKWKGEYASGKEFEEIHNAIIRCLAENNASIIVADATFMRVITSKDQQWIVDDWYPRAIDDGFKYEALITGNNSFNEATIRNIVHHYDEDKIITRYFSTYDEAVAWVKKIQHVRN